jgi:hypothetical protein
MTSLARAATLWMALGIVSRLETHAAAVQLFDFRAALRAGPGAWESCTSWGLRSRGLAAASADRQRCVDACGPAALAAVLRPRGVPVTQELLWSICRIPSGGTTLAGLAAAARCFGQACETRYGSTLEDLPLPAIVHLRRRHFVVLLRFAPERAEVFDPACGMVLVPGARLRREASGAALVFRPELQDSSLVQRALPCAGGEP